ncbi:BTB/POZ domain-containing protein 6-B-like [Paramacrobiotus metropolitanus]|uniref:BTB/POZ domain-containing protein 6-B-like n=1 Tax=Paramacrobiotus metropolitanus TaxID=2943436 RepID=UPI00244655A7|nr:BTB/POZ domain-containing protein 6-B-like [Paramacrobiotus metropolitanus]
MNPSSSANPDRAGPGSQVANCLQRLLRSGHLSDVHFSVGCQFGQTKDFFAHKLILAARSSVVHAMFYGSLPENCQIVLDIPDIHPEAFANLLSFMYADTVENLTLDNVFATMSCADKYDLPQLVEISSALVISQLKPENCLDILEEAIQSHADGIVQKCLELVDARSYRILHLESFTAVSPAALRMMLSRNTLTVEENVVWLAVERWAAAACARSNTNPSGANLREILGDVFSLIRFPLMTRSQLAKGPVKSGLLNKAEISSIITYQKTKAKQSLVFPTERRTGQQPLHPLTLRYGEDVFIPTVRGDYWEPARATAFNPSEVGFVYCGSSHSGTVTPDKVVRAADILEQGQPLQVQTVSSVSHQDATYDGMEGSQHRVSCSGRNVIVWFDCLKLLNSQVVSWKKTNGKL